MWRDRFKNLNAAAIPMTSGRPIGLMLIAKHWQESPLYRVADAFERARDWQTVGARKS